MTDKVKKLRTKLHTNRFKYSKKLFPFKEKISKLFGIELEKIHNFLGNGSLYESSKAAQSTFAHKVFYSNFEEKISPIYKSFMKEVIKPIVKLPFYYQKIPTFRLGLPGTEFVTEYHKDSDFNHQSYEINFNLGLANYSKGNFRVEKIPNSKQFLNVSCPYGEIVSINHIDCVHGCEPNNSKETMVSFDFRLAIAESYKDSSLLSLTNNIKFSVGHYFSEDLI